MDLFKKELVIFYLAKLKDCVENGKFHILQRLENIDFISKYNLSKAKQADILSGLTVEDFFDSDDSRKFANSYLYMFAPTVKILDAFGAEESVDMYIKFEIKENSNGEDVAVISFHKLEYPVQYPFRK